MESNKGIARRAVSQDSQAHATVAETVIGGGRKWRRISSPTPWTPVDAGEEIVGRFGGISTRTGPYGLYEVVTLTNDNGTYTLSGSHLAALVHAAGLLTPDDFIRVIYRGHRETPNGYAMKYFELYVGA